MGDWGFSLWAPEQWEALLHETLAPPFNEPMVDMPWDMPMLPRVQQQESAERGQDSVASAMLVTRLQRSFPVSCSLFLCDPADIVPRSLTSHYLGLSKLCRHTGLARPLHSLLFTGVPSIWTRLPLSSFL